MQNRIYLICVYIIFFTYEGNSVEFPNLCPNEKNIIKVCEELGKIESDKTLVFADGSEMPACLMQTMPPRERELAISERKLMYKIFDFLISAGISLGDKTYRTKMLKSKEQLISLKWLYPELSDIVDELLIVREKRLPMQRQVTIKTPPLNKEFDDALMGIKALVTQFPNGSKVSSKVARIGSEPSTKQFIDINCRQPPNAFFNKYFDNVSLSDSIKSFPPLTRKFILGHEIAHSFDPCFISMTDAPFKNNPDPDMIFKYNLNEYKPRKKPLHENPFESLINCIRDEVGKFKQEEQGNTDFCRQRHTREAFCDHIGTYLVSEHLKTQKYPQIKKTPQKVYLPPGYEAVFFFIDDTCAKDNLESSTHPASKRRLFDILLKNPIISKSLNCPIDSKAAYCDVQKGLVNGQNKTQTPISEEKLKKATK